jgi:hypothetical protein
LFFYEMIIVNEPFGCRGYCATVIDRLYGGTIRAEQTCAVGDESPRQKWPCRRSRQHDLRDSETARVIFEALNTEKFFAYG